MTSLEIWLMVLVTVVVTGSFLDDKQPSIGAGLIVAALLATMVVLRLWNYR